MRASCHLCIFASLLCALLQLSDVSGSKELRYKVIIVGAGVAGLSAAGKLKENNVTDFIILEARNRTGGRIHTTQFGNYKVELGAQYVHGQSENAVYQTVKHLNVLKKLGGTSGFGDIIVSPEGRQFHKNLYEEISDYVTNDTNGLAESRGSYSHYIVPRIKAYLSERNFSKTESEIITDAIKKVESAFRGAELDEVGVQGLSDYAESSDDIEMYWENGYGTFIKILMGNYSKEKTGNNISENIVLNKEVNKVTWGDDGVYLNCTDGSYYMGDIVLITLPLGVLKQGSKDLFSSKLPLKKRLAIQSLGYGILEHFYLMFPSKWWPDEIGGIDFGLSRTMKNDYRSGSHYGTWPMGITGFYTLPNAPLLLQGLIYGQAAKDMKHSNDAEVIEACYHMLKWLFENETFTVPKPTKLLRSNWYGDPYSMGSFSFRSVESDKKKLNGLDLGKPLLNSKKEPVVLFAGEATDLNYFSTVNGALNSGRREAKRILKYLTINENKSTQTKAIK